VWGGMLAPVPFFILSWVVEGPAVIEHSLSNVSWVGVVSVAYLAFVASLVGYVLWGRLLSRHPVAKIAPLSLLIPIVGLLCADLVLDEHLRPVQWVGGAIVLAGLAVNMFGPRLFRWRAAGARRNA
ncbi:MAG: EamA family transporter, partial [Alcaligenaceae bacterium]|nr:EamA family transporter [Alcaligenaceae bacterium]